MISVIYIICAQDVFMKGHSSASADVLKNLTANVLKNNFLCLW